MILEIEELAFNAWPASVTQQVDGWCFRFNGGVTGRANSVWPNIHRGEVPLGEKFAAAEAFYQRWKQPALFQVCPAAAPENLDALLDARGYQPPSSRTCVQVAELETVLARRPAPTAFTVTVEPHSSYEWFKAFAGEAIVRPESVIRKGIMDRIGPQTGFVKVREADQTLAVGLGVLERGWVGLFCIATLPEHRRRGTGTAVVTALAQWAAEGGATRAYLQVTAENTAAQSLYERLGFRTLYQYHYRKK